MKREKANYLIQAVSHSLDVLEELARANGEIGVTELSKRLKLHKNNVFRLLATLELRGYVVQNTQTENYALGVGCLELGQAYVANSSLVARAYPILRELSEQIGETVSFATLHNGYVSYPISIESKRPVKASSRGGSSYPAKQSVSGRLLTAQLPDTALEEILSGNTAQDAAIKSQLTELRNSGTIIDKGAVEADVICLAKTIKTLGGFVAGAIEITVPQYRSKVEQIMPKLEATAQALSTALAGGRKPGLASSVETEVDEPQTSRAKTTGESDSLLNPRAR